MKYIMKSPFKDIEYEKLLEWHHTLNDWQWPVDFIFPKPDGFDGRSRNNKYDFPSFDFVCKSLDRFICEYDRLKYHQCVAGYNDYDSDTNKIEHIKKTEEQFEEWYNKTFHTNIR